MDIKISPQEVMDTAINYNEQIIIWLLLLNKYKNQFYIYKETNNSLAPATKSIYTTSISILQTYIYLYIL